MSDVVRLRCKGVLFDMDGTLVDSTAVVERAWSTWASRYGFPLEKVLAFSHGRPTSATLEQFLPGQDHRPDLEVLKRTEETETSDIRPVPGALHAVEALRNHPWAVVTSAWRALAEERIRAAGLPSPRVLVPVDEIGSGKPHPEGFLRAAALLGIAPADCVVFEDTRPGIDAGLNAGMQVVGLLTTLSAAQLGYQPLIADFRDVTFVPQREGLVVELHVRSLPGTSGTR